MSTSLDSRLVILNAMLSPSPRVSANRFEIDYTRRPTNRISSDPDCNRYRILSETVSNFFLRNSNVYGISFFLSGIKNTREGQDRR